MLSLKTFLSLCFSILLLHSSLPAQSPFLVFPVEGTFNYDFMAVNYVDHDTSLGGILDYNCGYQTYDGHAGIDFVLRSFRQMDSGVGAVASAAGRVFIVVDSVYDRNKSTNVSLGFGNYVGIAHPGGYYSYYAHIRKSSALVKVGDSVNQGDRIALVGSAGNSTDPHLHFELYRDTLLVDPFGGTCSGATSLWISQPPYDTSLRLIDHGLFGWASPEDFTRTIDTIRERPPSKSIFTASDSTVTLWAHYDGTRAGDTIYTRWYDSAGALWFTFDYALPYDSRYFFYWTYVNRPPVGNWRVTSTFRDIQIDRSFIVTGPSSGVPSNRSTPAISASTRFTPDGILVAVTSEIPTGEKIDLELYDVQGELHAAQSIEDHGSEKILLRLEPHSGEYFLLIRSRRGGIVLPIVRLQ